MPTRFCVNSAGPGEVSRIANEIRISAGESARIRISERRKSIVRLTNRYNGIASR